MGLLIIDTDHVDGRVEMPRDISNRWVVKTLSELEILTILDFKQIIKRLIFIHKRKVKNYRFIIAE